MSVNTFDVMMNLLEMTGRVALDGPLIVPCGLPGGPQDDLTSFRTYGSALSGEDLPPPGAFVTVTGERSSDHLSVISWHAANHERPHGAELATVLDETSGLMELLAELERNLLPESPPYVLAGGVGVNDDTGCYSRELVLLRAPDELAEALDRVDSNLLWFSVFERETRSQ